MDEISDDDLVLLIMEAPVYGPLHPVLGEGNVQDDVLAGCLGDADLGGEEQAIVEALLAIEDKGHRIALVERGTGTSFAWAQP